MKVSALIDDAKRYVVGYYEDDGEQYVHWTEEDWLSYIRLSVGVIAATDVSLFTSVVEVPLQPGSVQLLPSQCESLRSVRGQLGENGEVDHLPRKRSMTSRKIPAISRKSCSNYVKGETGYKVKSYTVDPDDPKMIIVDPPVPSGADATLVITCYAPPTLDSVDDEIPFTDVHASVIFELVLYYAWGVDIEDQANRERSNTHWNNALKLLEISDKMQKENLKKLAVKAVSNGYGG